MKAERKLAVMRALLAQVSETALDVANFTRVEDDETDANKIAYRAFVVDSNINSMRKLNDCILDLQRILVTP